MGFRSSCSMKLTVCRLIPARAATRFRESFCRNRSSRRRRAISEQIRFRNMFSATHNDYKKKNLTVDATRVAYFNMFLRRLGPNNREGSALCAAGSSCPDILEMETGDFAVIGTDITEEARGRLLAGSGCGPGERIVLVPRKTLVLARPDIPAAL